MFESCLPLFSWHSWTLITSPTNQKRPLGQEQGPDAPLHPLAHGPACGGHLLALKDVSDGTRTARTQPEVTQQEVKGLSWVVRETTQSRGKLMEKTQGLASRNQVLKPSFGSNYKLLVS